MIFNKNINGQLMSDIKIQTLFLDCINAIIILSIVFTSSLVFNFYTVSITVILIPVILSYALNILYFVKEHPLKSVYLFIVTSVIAITLLAFFFDKLRYESFLLVPIALNALQYIPDRKKAVTLAITLFLLGTFFLS